MEIPSNAPAPAPNAVVQQKIDENRDARETERKAAEDGEVERQEAESSAAERGDTEPGVGDRVDIQA